MAIKPPRKNPVQQVPQETNSDSLISNSDENSNAKEDDGSDEDDPDSDSDEPSIPRRKRPLRSRVAPKSSLPHSSNQLHNPQSKDLASEDDESESKRLEPLLKVATGIKRTEKPNWGDPPGFSQEQGRSTDNSDDELQCSPVESEEQTENKPKSMKEMIYARFKERKQKERQMLNELQASQDTDDELESESLWSDKSGHNQVEVEEGESSFSPDAAKQDHDDGLRRPSQEKVDAGWERQKRTRDKINAAYLKDKKRKKQQKLMGLQASQAADDLEPENMSAEQSDNVQFEKSEPQSALSPKETSPDDANDELDGDYELFDDENVDTSSAQMSTTDNSLLGVELSLQQDTHNDIDALYEEQKFEGDGSWSADEDGIKVYDAKIINTYFGQLQSWEVGNDRRIVPPIEVKPDRETINVTDNDIVRLSIKAFSLFEEANHPQLRFFVDEQRNIIQLHYVEATNRLIFQTMDFHDSQHVLRRLAKWVKEQGQSRKLVNVSPSREIINDIYAHTNKPLPMVKLMLSQPSFVDDGALVCEPGYNSETKTFLDITKPGRYYVVPESPGMIDVEIAKTVIVYGLLAGFKFGSRSDRSNAIALFLIFLMRGMIDGPSPMHLVESPEFGAGKTYIVESIVLATTNRGLETTSLPNWESEFSRQLTAQLIKNPQYVFYDNVSENSRVDSAELAQALTGTIRGGRILGKSKVVNMSTQVIWITSGVNVSVSRELARRTVRIRIEKADPESFAHQDHLAWVAENRERILWAGLTLIKNWIVKGRPEAKKQLRSFDRWARSIGGILELAGLDGLLDNQEEFESTADPLHDSYISFVNTWWHAFGNRKVKSAKLLNMIEDEEVPLIIDGRNRTAMAVDLGNKLRTLKGRRFGRLSIEDAGITSGSRNWRLTEHD